MSEELYLYDTETCGLFGQPVTIQYARGLTGEVTIHSIWKEPIWKTLELIEDMMAKGTIGFNLVFDQFHLCKIYTLLSLWPDQDELPENIIEELAGLEMDARDGPCVKPKTALDLMLVARKGPYQSTMERKDIRIRRVPTALAWQLADELERRIEINPIYFARRKEKRNPWSVHDVKDAEGKLDPNFKDLVLSFAPSTALKVLVADALGKSQDHILLFHNVEVPRAFWPNELGYAPFARAIGKPGHWNGAWPEVIRHHIEHWHYDTKAREYAALDVTYLQELMPFFGNPEPGDMDSTLACSIAACRWRGYRVDLDGVRKLKAQATTRSKLAPLSPGRVKDWIWPDLNNIERIGTGGSTKKVVLEDMATWTDDDDKPHPAAIKAKAVLDARIAQKEEELYDKLLISERLHASFKIIGTLSSRMAGADGLNPQGIKREKSVRRCFPLADFDDSDWTLCGGDFESFEVVIADAVFDDPKLRSDLQNGKKIHALFAESLWPDLSYDDIMATKGTEDDKYSKGKQGVFSQIYGGDENTLVSRLNIGKEEAHAASENWMLRYPGIKRYQNKIKEMFCSMRQPGGIGSKVIWHEPAEKIEGLTGFPRFFTLENRIARALFDLGENPPAEWLKLSHKVTRRDREQTIGNAVRSALFGAAFGIQNAVMRAAGNHVIQNTGAIINKMLQCKLWELQPAGVHEWQIQPMNVHDELMAPTRKHLVPTIRQIVTELVESFRALVPLIQIDWSDKLSNWAEK
jgi:hypothetical protein